MERRGPIGQTGQLAAQAADARSARDWTRPLPRQRVWPFVLVAAITLLGGLVRLYHFTALSLWVDEGLTVQFSHFSWLKVAGLQGAYGAHPPLYFLLTKIASQTLGWMGLARPDLIAGRLISVVAGTLTIPVVYALAARLQQLEPGWSVKPDLRAQGGALWAPAGRPEPHSGRFDLESGSLYGLIVAVILAVSPAHVWYSEEARPYALVGLLVALSYLALLRGVKSRHWVIIYGFTVLLAAYTDQSAVFALAPQAIIIAYILFRERGQGFHLDRPGPQLLLAAMAAAALYLWWLPQLLSVAGTVGDQAQFAVTPGSVEGALLALTGLSANSIYAWGSGLSLWDSWPAIHPLLLLPVLVAAGLGALTLLPGQPVSRCRSPLGLLTALALAVGTLLAAVVVSLHFPSFAVRTVISALLGWSLLAAAPALAAQRSVRFFGAAALVGVVFLSLVTLWTNQTGGDKQHWNLLAAETAVAARYGPVTAYPSVAGTLLHLYQPDLQMHVVLDGRSRWTPSGPMLWLAYIDSPGLDRLQRKLAAAGYVQMVHEYFWNPLYLDLYLGRGARFGSTVDLRAASIAPSGHVLRRFTSAAAIHHPGNLRHQELLLGSASEAQISLKARPQGLYLLQWQERSHLHSGAAVSYLICATARGAYLAVAPGPAGAPIPNDRRWHTERIAILCPNGSSTLLISLRNPGTGTAAVRSLSLQAAVRRSSS